MNNNSIPQTAFNFLVDIDGIRSAGFSEVSGLNIETEIEQIEEGGTNNFVYQLPKRSKFSNITLKKGLTFSRDLYEWYLEIIHGNITHKKLQITLLDKKGKSEIRDWHFKNAFPIKWIGPDLNADSNNLAFESIELAHEGLSFR